MSALRSEPWFVCRGRAGRGAFDLQVDVRVQGRSLGIFGPSGAGKSSWLEALAGWVPFDGELHVHGRDLTAEPPERRGIGYVPQDLLLFPHRTVDANLRAGRARADAAVDLEDVVRTLELGDLLERWPHQLSGGERQRVSLGRALASGPDLLLLDEPLGSLDRPLRRRVLPFLLRVREHFDVPIVLVSHDPAEVHALCDEVCVLEGGRVVRQGAPADVLRGPDLVGTDYENVVAGVVEALEPGIARVRLEGGASLRIPGDDAEVGERVLVGLRAEDILLATGAVDGLSARNAEPATVESLTAAGSAVHVALRLGEGPGAGVGPRLWSRVTPGAVLELGLEPGSAVRLVMKTRAAQRLA